MATPEELWGARSANAQAFADLLASNAKPRPKTQMQPTEDSSSNSAKKGYDLISGDSLTEYDNENKTAWYEKPVVKGIIDALSIGTYTTAAIGTAGAIAKGKADEAAERGESGLGTFISESINQTVNHNPVVMGVKAAFGDDDSRRTWSDAVKQGQRNNDIDPETDEAKKISGAVGLAGDIILDPLWLVPGGAVVAGGKGAAVGATKAALAAKKVKAGVDVLGAETSTIRGAIDGAKKELEAVKVSKAEGKELKRTRAELNAGIKSGVPLETLAETTVKGFDFLPESVKAGTKKASAKDVRTAANSAKLIESTANVPVGSGSIFDAQTPAWAKSVTNSSGSTSRMAKSEELAARFIEADSRLVGLDVDAAKVELRKVNREKADLRAIAKAESIDLDKAVFERKAFEAGKADLTGGVPRATAGAQGADEVMSDLPAAHNYVNTPNAIDINNFKVDTTADKLIKGTADVTAPANIYSQARTKKVMDSINTSPGLVKKVVEEAKIDPAKVTQFLRSRKGVSRKDMGESAVSKSGGMFRTVNPKTGKPYGKNAKAESAIERRQILTTMGKVTEKEYTRLVSRGEFDKANDVISNWLTKNLHPEDLDTLLRLSRAKVSPAVTENIWDVKPNMVDFRNAAFAGEKNQPSLGQVQNIIATFGKDMPTVTSGKFSDLIKAYSNGTMPTINRGKFETAIKSTFGLADDADPQLIASTLSDYLKTNALEVKGATNAFAPNATTGRLAMEPNGATSDGIRLVESLPEGAAERYSRPLRPQEAEAVADEMSKIAEANIINGRAPELVAKAVDDITAKHIVDYNTPLMDASGNVLRTRKKYSTSTAQLNSGGAKHEDLWTTHAQTDQFNLINDSVREIMKQDGTLAALRKARDSAKYGPAKTRAGAEYQAAFRQIKDDLMMRIWGGVDANLKQAGIFGYLTNVMVKGEPAIRATAFDILAAMGPELRMKHLWVQPGTMENLRMTQASDVFETLIRAVATAGPEGIISQRALMDNARDILKGGFTKATDKAGLTRVIESNLDYLTREFNENIIETQIKRNAAMGDKAKFKDSATKSASTKILNARERMYSQFITDLMKVGEDGLSPLQKASEAALRNMAMDGVNMSSKIIHTSEAHLARVRGAIESGDFSTAFDAVISVTRADKLAPEAIETLEGAIKNINNTYFSPAELAGIKAQGDLTKLFHPGPAKMVLGETPKAITAGKVAFGNTIRVPQRSINTANANVAKATANPALADDMILDTAARFDDEVVVDMMRLQDGHDLARRTFISRKLFDVRFGMWGSYDTITRGMHGTTQIETAFYSAMNEFSRKFTMEQSVLAMKGIQAMSDDAIEALIKGGGVGADPQTYEMARLVSTVFDPSKNNIFVRNGIGPETMNRVMTSMTSVPQHWRFDPNLEPTQMAAAWKEWSDISNPFKALAAVHTALMKATESVSAGARYSHQFGVTRIPVGEEAHWAKLGNLDKLRESGKGEFVSLIDDTLYYPKELIAELPELNRFITGSRSFKEGWFQQSVGVFDNLTSALKVTQTVMKPGHHVMSITGDFFRNSLAGLNSINPYKDSWRVIRSMNEGNAGLSEMDKFVKLQTAMSNSSISSAATGLTLKVGGNKKFVMSYDDLYTQFANRGIFLPPHNGGVAEDLLSVPGQNFDDVIGGKVAKAFVKGSQNINKAVSATVNNKVIKMNSFTSQRDNLFRGALAIDVMKKGNFKTVEEAIDAAERHVRKWAPIAKDLTNAESKYVRRVFLYYTWLRGMIPRVVESLVRKPALATLPSKAMYGIAQMNGLDPNSFGDPFDPNEMFPSYYKEGVLGPQWQDPESGHLWGMNPTSPIMDVMNSVGSGVSLQGFIPGASTESNYTRMFQTVTGMMNPLFRAPAEFGMGTQMGTGAPINSKSQYALDMIGPVRQLSKVTGKTFDPFQGGIVNRTEAKYRDGLEGDDFWNNAKLETFNWGVGLQAKDYTSDSAQRTADFEQNAKNSLETEQQLKRLGM